MNIKVNSEALSKVVQQLLFDHGYKWTGTGGSYWPLPFFDTPIALGGGYMCYGTVSGPTIDAATEFGKLIEFLKTKAIRVAGYDGKVRADKSGIDIGCQFVTKDQVEKVKLAMEGNGNEPSLVITGLSNPTLRKVVAGIVGTSRELHDTNDEMRVTDGTYRSMASKGYYKGLGASLVQGHTFIHAPTEIGKLIDLMQGGTTQVSIGDGTYTAEITGGKLKVGTSEISKETVDEIWSALQ